MNFSTLKQLILPFVNPAPEIDGGGNWFDINGIECRYSHKPHHYFMGVMWVNDKPVHIKSDRLVVSTEHGFEEYISADGQFRMKIGSYICQLRITPTGEIECLNSTYLH